MNVNKKEEVLFSIMDITPEQAKDLLSISIKSATLAVLTLEECETSSNLRQALLQAGVTKGE